MKTRTGASRAKPTKTSTRHSATLRGLLTFNDGVNGGEIPLAR